MERGIPVGSEEVVVVLGIGGAGPTALHELEGIPVGVASVVVAAVWAESVQIS